LGRATANTKFRGSSRSISSRARTDSPTSLRRTSRTSAVNSAPEPSNNTTRVPGLARITWIKWCAWGPSTTARSLTIGCWTKNRSVMGVVVGS
jgi:hypothetical protein